MSIPAILAGMVLYFIIEGFVRASPVRRGYRGANAVVYLLLWPVYLPVVALIWIHSKLQHFGAVLRDVWDGEYPFHFRDDVFKMPRRRRREKKDKER